MTRGQAIKFLESHQPLPDTIILSQAELDDFYHVIQYIVEDSNPTFIPLLLNIFGSGDANGLYMDVEDVMKRFSREEVIPHLVYALASENRNVVYWCTQIAESFPSPEICEKLAGHLASGDDDIRLATISALECAWEFGSQYVIIEALEQEIDHHVQEALEDALKQIRRNLSST